MHFEKERWGTDTMLSSYLDPALTLAPLLLRLIDLVYRRDTESYSIYRYAAPK